VLFIYREEQYDPDIPIERRGDAEIIVAKHRNGPTGSVHLAFLSQYARFENMSRV
jgi:replicative DNA helicase